MPTLKIVKRSPTAEALVDITPTGNLQRRSPGTTKTNVLEAIRKQLPSDMDALIKLKEVKHDN